MSGIFHEERSQNERLIIFPASLPASYVLYLHHQRNRSREYALEHGASRLTRAR